MADEFDFHGVVDGGSFDELGAVVVEQAKANGGIVALIAVAGEEELLIALLEAGFFVFQADLLLVGLNEFNDRSESFEEIIGREVGVLD